MIINEKGEIVNPEMEELQILDMYVVYSRPADYPTEFVVRIHHFNGAGYDADPDLYCRARTIEDIRLRLSSIGKVCLGRTPEDHPEILETWI